MREPTILVVDPNEDQRRLLTSLLREHGYRVLETRTAPDALRLARTHAPDLVLGEHPVGPPDDDPLCVTLRATPETARIPFLALTARAMPDEIDAARRAHPAGVLLKPVPLHRILAAVGSILALRGKRGLLESGPPETEVLAE